MYLTKLLDTYQGQPDPEIKGLTPDSRQVQSGWLFAALPGSRTDGCKYIPAALDHGARAILVPAGTQKPDNFQDTEIAWVADENPRRQLSLMAARFYGQQPGNIAAVTGTNGKTSVVHFTQQLWQSLGIKAASLGTLGVHGSGVERPGSLTTPDQVSLHSELADLAAADISHLAMEASSHGLSQYRLDGARINIAAFTNLSRDHLDYHESMDEYLQAKARLFSEVLVEGGTAVLNADAPEYASIEAQAAKRGIQILSYGYAGKDIRLEKREPSAKGQDVKFSLSGRSYEVTIPLVGEFQVMNALCALGIVWAEVHDSEKQARQLVKALSELQGAPGRLQLVEGHPQGAVYIDYAHTPDALENVLKALRPHTKGRLICLVGCGGDRDPGKRPMMARIAAQQADITIITDDNPRTEDPSIIRAQMREGALQAEEIGDRRAAIHHAVHEMKEGDVLLVAGKGHEQGQIIGKTVEPFDDVKEAGEAIALLGKSEREA